MTKPFKILALLASVALSACVSLLPDPQEADAVYRLSPSGVAVTANADAVVMRVDRPIATTVLSGRDIVISRGGRELVTAGGARWSESIPVLIQQSVLGELGQRKSIIGVEPTAGARANFRMSLAVRNFEVTFDEGKDNAPLAIVHYGVTVANASTRELVSTFDVRKTVRANQARVSSIVEATDNANEQAVSDIVDWLETLTFDS